MLKQFCSLRFPLKSVLQGELGIQVPLVQRVTGLAGGELTSSDGLHLSHFGPVEQQRLHSRGRSPY